MTATYLPGANRQFQPDILLDPVAVLNAMNSLFALAYAGATENYHEDTGDASLLPPPRARLEQWAPEQEADDLLAMAWYLLGRVEQAWGEPVGLVFHHAGIISPFDQEHALTDLFLGLQGHGVCLADDFDEAIKQAGLILGKTFDETPFYDEMDWLDRLAKVAVESAVREASEATDA